MRRTDIRRLCGLLHDRLEDGTWAIIVCDVGEVAAPGLEEVDALARLQLVAGRAGLRIHLLGVSDRLRELLTLAGLRDLLPQEPSLGPER